MHSSIQVASDTLLKPFDLELLDLETVVGQAMGKSVDSADIYLQSVQEEGWVLEEGIVKEGRFSIDQGFGLRVISGEKTGFAYADAINSKALLQATHLAKSIVYSNSGKKIEGLQKAPAPLLYDAANPLYSLTAIEKVNLLNRIDQYTRAKDPRVKQVIISLTACHELVLVANNEGVVAADVRPL